MSVYKPTGIKKIFHETRRSIAQFWISQQSATQIAITGSQGKTNTTSIITHVCSYFGKTITTDLALDTTFNVPITALKVRPWTKYIVWELGIDHPGEMANHLQIAKPSVGIITGISPVHTDAEHMGSLQKLIEEKRKLIEALPKTGTAILNADDKNVVSMAPFTKAQVIWYGSQKNANVWVEKNSTTVSMHGTSAIFHDKDQRFELKTKLIGIHHVYNIMAAFLVAKTIHPEITPGTFQTILNKVEPIRGRMNIEKGPFNTILLNDSIRANPESTRVGLETLEKIAYSKGKKIAVIGEMGELESPEEEHRKTGAQIAQMHLDYVLCIGTLRNHTVDEAVKNGFPRKKIGYAEDVFEASEKLREILKPNDLWYLKGSLLRNYKRIIQLLNNETVCCNNVLCPYEHCGYN